VQEVDEKSRREKEREKNQVEDSFSFQA